MNCRDGDLAYYVGSQKQYHFYIVKVSNLSEFMGEPSWMITPPLPYGFNFKINSPANPSLCLDSSLRPIRDSDKQDEMLSIINIKEKV